MFAGADDAVFTASLFLPVRAGSGTWANTGDANGTGPGLGISTSMFPFETSGMNAGALLDSPRPCQCLAFTRDGYDYRTSIWSAVHDSD